MYDEWFRRQLNAGPAGEAKVFILAVWATVVLITTVSHALGCGAGVLNPRANILAKMVYANFGVIYVLMSAALVGIIFWSLLILLDEKGWVSVVSRAWRESSVLFMVRRYQRYRRELRFGTRRYHAK